MAVYTGKEVSSQYKRGLQQSDFPGNQDGRGLGYTHFQGGASYSDRYGVITNSNEDITERREYHIQRTRLTNSGGGNTNEEFIGPEPIFHSQQELDDYIAAQGYSRNQYTDPFYSADIQGEATGAKQQRSALLITLKPQRFEMPNHISYHGELDTKEAERRLSIAQGQAYTSSCYLTRFSKGQDSYVVSALGYYNGSQTPVHFKLNIDNENGHSLEGTKKIYRTLDELLHYYEQNPLNHYVRGLGTPVASTDQPPPGTPSRTSAHNKEKEDINPLHLLQDMQKNFVEELGKQREDHKKQLEEERKLFKETIDQERQAHRDSMEARRRQDEANANAVREAALAQTLPEQQPQAQPVEDKKKSDCTIL